MLCGTVKFPPVLYRMIRWNPSLYTLTGFVTLPRRFRLGIVSGGELSSSYKAGTAYLLYYRLLNFLFGIFDPFLDMISICIFRVPLGSCGMCTKILVMLEYCGNSLQYKKGDRSADLSLSQVPSD